MVTVIIPVYNVGEYIEECVKSVLDQSYKDIEIIVVDDGSDDGTSEICKQLAEESEIIEYVRQENKGVSVARNKGIEKASGEYIMFLDGDDKLDKTIISRLLEYVGIEVNIVSCCCKAFDDKETFDDHFFDGNRVFESDTDKSDLFLQLINPNIGQSGRTVTAIGVPWGKLYKTEFVKNNNLLFDPELRRLQDNVFNMYAFAASGKIVYIDEPLYWYRIQHISSYYGFYRSPENMERVISARRLFFRDNKVFFCEKVRNEFEKDVFRIFVSGLKYYASGSKTYNSSVRNNLMNMRDRMVYKGCLDVRYSEEPIHEMLIASLVRFRLFFLLYCVLRITL